MIYSILIIDGISSDEPEMKFLLDEERSHEGELFEELLDKKAERITNGNVVSKKLFYNNRCTLEGQYLIPGELEIDQENPMHYNVRSYNDYHSIEEARLAFELL